MFGKGSKAFRSTVLVALALVMAGGPIASASEPFLGEIKIIGFNYAPRGWAYCQGQLLSISQNQALYALLGTTYGGDGRTSFGLPDLRGRVPVGAGRGAGLWNYSLGHRGGQEMVTLDANQLPNHTHQANAYGYSGSGNEEGPGDNVWAQKNRDDDYSSQAPNVMMAAAAIDVLPAGGGQSHENRQPYLAVNFVIALQGIFPARD